MKTIYPTDLVARPDSAALNKTDIRLGDVVYLQPKNGPQIASTVIYGSPVFGCTTYTADASCNKGQRIRFRFRLKDVHHVGSREEAVH